MSIVGLFFSFLAGVILGAGVISMPAISGRSSVLEEMDSKANLAYARGYQHGRDDAEGA